MSSSTPVQKSAVESLSTESYQQYIEKQQSDLKGLGTGFDFSSVARKMPTRMNFEEIGEPGLRIYSGFLEEEFLPELRGHLAARIYQEMRDNDPTVGAMLYIMDNLIQNATLSVLTDDTSQEGLKARALVESCFNDMVMPWEHVMSEILTFLPFGYSWMEVTLKHRRGYHQDPMKASQYSDGLIGWGKMALRGQDTTYRWHMDNNMNVRALEQLPPPTYVNTIVPWEKSLHFTVRPYKSNPEGRALDPDTQIPTPDGWKKLGDLSVGSKIFDDTGRVRYITARAVWDNRPRYRLTFSDGSQIIADANHQWLTQNQYECNAKLKGKLRTTAEIADDFKTSAGVSNHAIRWAEPIDYPEQLLPFDPYALGLWLGDGTSASANIACHVQDVEETSELLQAVGYGTRVLPNGTSENGRSIRIYSTAGRWSFDNPTAILRQIGVLNNKHIPPVYLRGSIEQRKALLAGLMDSDGTVDGDGRCEFTNINRNLVDGVAELVRSLGTAVKVSLRKHADAITHIHDSYCVKFTPDFSPFRLTRKADRIKLARSRKYHYITACEKLSAGTTICIEVDSPSHLFLAGTSMVPTHNSVLRNAYRPWFFMKRIEEIEAIAVERELNGMPVLTPPEGYNLWNQNDLDAARLLARSETLVRNIRQDQHQGVVLPFGWTLTLLSASGQRSLDTSIIINRYAQRIATVVIADMLLIGQERVGSFALVAAKVSLFSKALRSIANIISGVFNRYAIPRLLRANGMSTKNAPYIKFGPIDTPDLKSIAEYVNKLVGNNVLTPDLTLERHLREIASMPQADPVDETFPAVGIPEDPSDDDEDPTQENPGPRPGPSGANPFSDKPTTGSSQSNLFPPEGGEQA